MKVLLVEPNADPRTIEIDGSLASMQSLVGGLIEAIYPFSDPIALICNDDGKLAGLPQNRPLKHPETGEIYDIVCGPFFLCSAPSDSENFESLPEDLIEKYHKIFALPKFVCTSCGNNFYREQLSPFDGELLCPACLSSQTVYCSCCDRRIWTDDNVGTDAQPLCQDCFDDHFERCTTCNALIRRGDTYYRGDTPYCAECYQSVGCGDEIMSYYFKPTPIFYGEGKRFFGVELEIDGAGEDNDNAAEILHIANVERPLVYLDTRYFEVSEPEPQRVIAAQHTEQPTPETPQAVQNLMGQRVEIDGKLYNVDSADETVAHLSVVSSSSESNHDPEHRTEPVSAVLTRIADQGRELAPNISAYQALRAEHPEKLIGVRVGERLLFYGADAKRAASALNRRLLQRDIPGMGETAVTGYDFGQWASAAKRLLEHGHSFVFAQPNETDGYDVINDADAKEYIPIGMELKIDGRKFVIDSVNFGTDEVSLRDVTFQNRQGFPIFRAEHIAFIRSFVEEQEREQPQPVTKPVAFYPAEKTHLPYDIEIQTLHIPEPEHDPPSAEPAKPEPPAMSEEERLILEHEGRAALSEMGEFVPDFDDAISQAEIDEPPAHRPAVSVPIDGEWQGFPSVAAAEQAAYADFKAASHRDAQNFHITDDALGVGGAKAKFRANMAAIQLLQELEFEGLQASPEQQEILSRYVGWGGLADAFDENKPNWSDEFAEL